MSTFRNPVGPQPPQVYWRRRLMVALGLLAVIIVIVLIIVRPGSGDDAPKKPDASSSATPPPSASAEPPAKAGAVCKTSSLSLEAITDAGDYPAGATPMLSMKVTNNGAVACTLDVSSNLLVFTITSGQETYWTSSDCQADPAPATVLLQPGESKSTTPAIAWDRTRSSPTTCDVARSPVTAGGASYHLSVKIGELKAEATRQFLLF